ncbi:MAG TPA: cupin domain-containing protein [Candidatus Tumulicola sp.]|nr:cupin domain-containing protein [Candidatus Tumulicola sp.]
MKLPVAILASLLVASAVPVTVAIAATAPTIVTPSHLQWAPGKGMPAGVKVAVLTGNPNASGAYAVRLMLPDGTLFGPHFHGDAEWVTVLQGTLMVGLGDKVDKTKMKALGPGSFVAVPAGLHHYAMAKGATIIQLTGMGPMTMTAVKGSM